MSRVFVPTIYVLIPTEGAYHPVDSVFKVSIGQENSTTVFKVQLVVEGRIKPRLTLSYDVQTDQFAIITKAYDFLKSTYATIPSELKEQIHDANVTDKFKPF